MRIAVKPGRHVLTVNLHACTSIPIPTGAGVFFVTGSCKTSKPGALTLEA